jgi:hypothetical protein
MRGASLVIAAVNGAAALFLIAMSGHEGHPPAPVADVGEAAADVGEAAAVAQGSDRAAAVRSVDEAAESAPAGAAPLQPAWGESAQDVIDEIQGIRRQLGIDPLAGSSLERIGPRPDGDAFLDSLRDVVPTGTGVPANVEHGNGERNDDRSHDGLVDPANELGAIQHFGGLSSPLGASESLASPFVDSLRRAAEQLDTRANQLERQREYEHADRLRRLANRLRRELRIED